MIDFIGDRMMNIELLNAVIAATTSVFVVILSQLLIRNNEKRKALDADISRFRKYYINPIRFILSENYYRLYEIMEKEEKREKLLVVDESVEVRGKNMDWFVKDGCYLISSCYFTACLFVCMENIRNGIPFFKSSYHNDTKIMELINKLVVDFSSNLNIFYVIQMNIGKELYIKDENRVLTYREFCVLLKNEENFKWYQTLIDYYLRIGKGESIQQKLLLVHIKELSKFLDKMVLGGDSIKQKMLAEGKIYR